MLSPLPPHQAAAAAAAAEAMVEATAMATAAAAAVPLQPQPLPHAKTSHVPRATFTTIDPHRSPAAPAHAAS